MSLSIGNLLIYSLINTMQHFSSFHSQGSMKHVKSLFRIVFILLMFSLNMWLIVVPTLEKYLQRAIVVEVSSKPSDSLQAPAVTFCRYGPQES